MSPSGRSGPHRDQNGLRASITQAVQGPRALVGWGWAGKDRPMDDRQRERIGTELGFFAALDQSGGSTPKALAEYGIDKSRYDTEAEMFDLVHEMRTRIIT